ncbi:flagellar hook-basal body complex protein FliE [Sansalvadorimonas sp. 2012CJ34-2]|uniref:Flagellar hook-basal body complex protein FliE n=1 Tax=Parendozoicomonas callyspongiae TaxID=2942213 RepID=A0ABT0PDV0_9GAMM|nr:flagellar hook-basal body complex protein FliE [Sansalvadorimonas sp. 2012CJ34-2]MCL6269540.1 flagellar hook-basal body complex protein FliE [Sansalvadorimonas sp. 2012CJ34-2]
MTEINLLVNMNVPTIDSIPDIYGQQGLPDDAVSSALQGNVSQGYLEIFRQSLETVNTSQNLAAQQMTAVSLHKSDDLIGTVMAIQNASLSFQFLLQARNRVVEGYHELFNQQI